MQIFRLNLHKNQKFSGIAIWFDWANWIGSTAWKAASQTDFAQLLLSSLTAAGAAAAAAPPSSPPLSRTATFVTCALQIAFCLTLFASPSQWQRISDRQTDRQTEGESQIEREGAIERESGRLTPSRAAQKAKSNLSLVHWSNCLQPHCNNIDERYHDSAWRAT